MVESSTNGSRGSCGTDVDKVKREADKAINLGNRYGREQKLKDALSIPASDTAMNQAFAVALQKFGKKNKVTRVHDSIIIEMKD